MARNFSELKSGGTIPMLSPHPEKWGDASPPRPPTIDARGMPYYLTAKFSLKSTCQVTRLPPGLTALSSSTFFVQLHFPYVFVVIII